MEVACGRRTILTATLAQQLKMKKLPHGFNA
jgi:hypothetical protein